VIAPQIAGRTKGCNGDQGDRGTGLRARIGARRDGHSGVQIRPRNEPGVLGILGRENIKRQAARKRRNSGDGPAANQRTGNASGRVVVGAPERKLPRVVHNQTMRDVEFGVAALGAQVERVSRIGREENVVADGNERICPVINGLRIGVGSLQREAV